MVDNESGNAQPLPDGWVWATIPEMIDVNGVFSDGDWVESKDQDPNGDVRLVQLADIGDGRFRDRSNRFLTSESAAELNCTFLEPGDLLIARMPDPLGRACVFPGDARRCVTAVDVCIVRTGQQSMSHRWLMFAVNSPQSRTSIASYQSGSTRKRISRRNLAKILYPIPPLPEQHRIVAEIKTQFTRLDAAVASLERMRGTLRRYRASVLKTACEGRLVPTEAELARAGGREYEPAEQLLARILVERRARWEAENPGKRYKEPASPNMDGLPKLPKGWVWTNMLTLTVSGPQNGLYLPKSLYGKGVPILRIDDYQNDWSRSSDELQKVNATEEQVRKFGLGFNDLVINRVNSLTHLGKCLVISKRNLPALFESNMMRLCLSDLVNPKFVKVYLHSGQGRLRLIRSAKHAVNQASINQKDVGNTCVPLPPLPEQHRIVAEVERRLSVVEALEATVKANLRRAGRLRQAILKRAFEGRLAPQDPNDEPASVLLERIHAQRLQSPKRSKAGEARTSGKGKRKAKQMRLPTT